MLNSFPQHGKHSFEKNFLQLQFSSEKAGKGWFFEAAGGRNTLRLLSQGSYFLSIQEEKKSSQKHLPFLCETQWWLCSHKCGSVWCQSCVCGCFNLVCSHMYRVGSERGWFKECIYLFFSAVWTPWCSNKDIFRPENIYVNSTPHLLFPWNHKMVKQKFTSINWHIICDLEYSGPANAG